MEALEAMKPKERERYLETETQRQMRVAPPKPKKAPAGSSDERESAEADYLAAVEEWELGIPPEPTSLSGENDLFSMQSMIVFKSWATTQPVTELTST